MHYPDIGTDNIIAKAIGSIEFQMKVIFNSFKWLRKWNAIAIAVVYDLIC